MGGHPGRLSSFTLAPAKGNRDQLEMVQTARSIF
jgi:hypothetical protein